MSILTYIVATRGQIVCSLTRRHTAHYADDRFCYVWCTVTCHICIINSYHAHTVIIALSL